MKSKWNKPTHSIDSLESFLKEGNRLLQAKDFHNAIKYYKHVLSVNPSHVISLFNSANAYLFIKYLDESILSALKALELAPNEVAISDFVIQILNFYTPNFEKYSSYIDLDKKIKEIDVNYSCSEKISDDMVKQLCKKFEKIINQYEADINGTKQIQLFRGKYNETNNCIRHKEIFKKFKIIPRHCFDCYKVVVEPRTVNELIKLLLVFTKIELINKNHRKCMIEMRSGITGKYKGFVYCRDIAEGKDILETIKQVVSNSISRNISVSLKRGCSEFAQVFPGYEIAEDGKVSEIKYDEKWQKHEELVDSYFHLDATYNPNNFTCDHSGFTLLDALVIQNWVKFSERD